MKDESKNEFLIQNYFMNDLQQYYLTQLGCYEPAIFHIHHTGDKRLSKWKMWPEGELSTLFHEYIHFLQDISTIQGMFNMYLWSEYLKGVTQEILTSPDKIIHTPILPSSLKNNIDNNFLINQYGLGQVNPHVVKFLSYKKIQPIQIANIQMPRVQIECRMKDGKIVFLDFGAIMIMENMAKLIQNHLFPTLPDKSPICPYHAVEFVADKIYPGISKNTEVMVALCDASLQSSNPGAALVRYLELLQAQSVSLSEITVDSIYTEVYTGFVRSTIPSSGNNFLPNFNICKKLSINSLCSYDTNHIWPNIRNYFHKILNFGEELRINHPTFFIDLLRAGNLQENAIFQYFLDEVGTPLITNALYDEDFIAPKCLKIKKQDMVHIYAFNQVSKAFDTRDNELDDQLKLCSLQNLCKKHHCWILGNKVDERCEKAPWQRVKDCPKCYYGLWWHLLAFKDVTIVRS